VTVIQAYAPTETAEDSEKDEFYRQLQDSLDEIPSYDIKLLIGDFNVQIDSDRRGRNVAVGPHGTAKETTFDQSMCQQWTEDWKHILPAQKYSQENQAIT